MDILEKNLTQFSLIAAESLDELWSVMLGDVSLTEDAGVTELILRRYLDLTREIGMAADSNELIGVQFICAIIEANLLAFDRDKRILVQAEVDLLSAWPGLLLGYVISEGDSNAGEELIQHLALAGWAYPLSDEDAAILRNMLFECPEVTATSVPNIAEMSIAPAATESTGIQDPLLPSDTQQVDREMLNMLSKEFIQMDGYLSEDLAAVVVPQFSVGDRQLALTNYTELLGRFAAAAESIGLMALSAVFLRFVFTLSAIVEDLHPEQHALLEQLPGRVTAYLTWPTDESAGAALIDLLTDVAWRTPVDINAAQTWVKSLANVEITENNEQKPKRQSEASAADVSLTLPDDIHAELLDGLLQELPIQTSAFTAAIERLTIGQGSNKDVDRAMRAAHTLKGAANTVGVRGIANLTHHVEDILVALSEANAMPDRALANILTHAGDCLEAMCEALMGVGPAPIQAQKVLQEVLDSANRIDLEGVSVTVNTSMPDTLYEALEQPKKFVQEQGESEIVAQQGNMLRVPAPVVEEMLRLAGETLISNSQIQERLRLTSQQADGIKQQIQSFQQLVAELEYLVDVRGVAAPKLDARDKGDFDPLEFEHFSDLHTVTRRLVEAANDAQQMQMQVNEQLNTLGELLEVQQRLHMDSQHAVIRTRLVPVSSVVSRLQRSVRQTCRLLDKQVSLEIKGVNTSIDSNVLNELMDPLMHILRNAVDHGIEVPAARAAADKSVTGKIELSFSRTGNTIVVCCKDDGAGLNYAAIQRIAESKGILTSERDPSPDELARLILVSGFSTRDETTQISGRGIGMDVVYSRILEMKGTLALNSEHGAGLKVELHLPATLLSAHTLVVRHCGKLIAVSSHGVEDIHYITVDQIEQIGNQQIYRMGDLVHTLVKLETLLDLPNDKREADRLGFPVLLTRTDSGATRGVLVQEVVNSREVVLKNFGRYVPKIQGTVGAVILGDGSVAPVIDLVELLRTPTQRQQNKQFAPVSAQIGRGVVAGAVNQEALSVLVVDDSLSARRAASKVMQDAGYTVHTAIDGLEAMNILQGFVPSIMLVDMEMPRMNGIELTTHVRSSVRTKNVPVIMITSRSTEKHRQMGKDAGVDVYLTKPFSDDMLIEHVEQLVRR